MVGIVSAVKAEEREEWGISLAKDDGAKLSRSEATLADPIKESSLG
jgi:hypothetical protein